MEEDSTFKMNLMNIWKNEVFIGSTHAIIPHNIMELLREKNMHIVEITCIMLNKKNLPNYFWAEVIAIIMYIMN